jgi:hypothetical protein
MTLSEHAKLREQWQVATTKLGVDFVAPFSLSLPDGALLEYAILLPQFGSEHGMLINPEHSVLAFAAAVAAGYGVTSMSPEALQASPDLEIYIECLRDWGWVAEEPAPEWYAGAA